MNEAASDSVMPFNKTIAELVNSKSNSKESTPLDEAADEEVVHDLARQKTNIIIGEFSKRGSIKGSNT